MMCAIVEQQVIFLANETSRTKCFFLLMCLLLFLFIFLNVKFLNCIFTFYPTTSKSILFLPTHQNKYSLSLYCFMFTFIFIFHMYTFRDSILHSPKLFSTALTSVKKFAQKLLFYPSLCKKKQSTIL